MLATEGGLSLQIPSNGSNTHNGQNKRKKTFNKLQHKLMDTSSATNMYNRLKTPNIGRQTRISLRTQYGSSGKATPVAIESTIDSSHVHQPHFMKVMITKISRNTKDNIEGELLCLEALFPNHEQLSHDLQMKLDPLLAFKTTTDQDTMYMHEVMREPDWSEFQKAMTKEVEDQMKNGNFSIINRSQVPKGKIVLPAVWQMKRKRAMQKP